MEFEDVLEDQRVDRGRGPRDAAEDRVGEDALTMAKVECVDIRLVSAAQLVMRYRMCVCGSACEREERSKLKSVGDRVCVPVCQTRGS